MSDRGDCFEFAVMFAFISLLAMACAVLRPVMSWAAVHLG